MEKIKRYLISLLIAFCISITLIIITAVIFAYTNIDDRYLQSFVTGIVTISCLVSSIVLAKKIKQKGIIYGAIFGLVYCLIIYILNTCIYGNFFISNTLLVYLGVCTLSGIVGGIIGVNV